jgi:hypothetical protein
MDKTPKKMDTLEYFKRLSEQPISQEEIDERNEKLEQRDEWVIEISQLYEAIEHYESDLRYHVKQVRCDTAILEGEIKRILKERGEEEMKIAFKEWGEEEVKRILKERSET